MKYRHGDAAEGSRYGYQFIPHLIIADAKGNQLFAYDAPTLIAAHKQGLLAETIFAKARELSK